MPQIIQSVTEHIYLNISGSQATANIFIPFPVHQIIVRETSTYFNETTRAVLVSNLVDNKPLGILNELSAYSYTASWISHTWIQPKNILGTYTFTLLGFDKSPITADGDICLMLEFIQHG